MATELLAGLADMEARQREAFLLAAVAGLGYEDAAAVMGVPPGEVAEAVYRARARLAELLGGAVGGSARAAGPRR